MAKEVKIIWFYRTFSEGEEGTSYAEKTIAALLNEGWIIAGTGGGPVERGFHAFVILQRG